MIINTITIIINTKVFFQNFDQSGRNNNHNNNNDDIPLLKNEEVYDEDIYDDAIDIEGWQLIFNYN